MHQQMGVIGCSPQQWEFCLHVAFANSYPNHGDPRNQKQRNLHFYQTVHQHHHPKMAIPWWTRAQDTLGQHEALSQDNSGNTSDPRGNQ